MSGRNWQPIIQRASEIAEGYPLGITLRQLHYLLASEPHLGYRNDLGCYKRLSDLSAAGRREGWFPPLLDQTREVHQLPSWTSPKEALLWLAKQYHRDRTENQNWCIVLGGEKATLLVQLESWFRDLGFPIVLLKGYGSQTYLDDGHREDS